MCELQRRLPSSLACEDCEDCLRLAAAACLAAQSIEGRLGLRPDGGRVAALQTEIKDGAEETVANMRKQRRASDLTLKSFKP